VFNPHALPHPTFESVVSITMQLQSREIEAHGAHTLLTLPMEVRASILRDLLSLPTCLVYRGTRKHRNRHDKTMRSTDEQSQDSILYPQILRVCKQLHIEGRSLLFANPLGLDFWVDDLGPVTWSFVGSALLSASGFFRIDRLWPMTNVAKPWKESLKLHISIHFDNIPSDDDETEDGPPDPFDCETLRDQLEFVCTLLFTKQNFKVCDATVAILGLKKGYEPGEDTTIGLLQPLSLLRCKRAVITGVSDAYAAEVASRMMSPTPARNLYAMRGALKRYVQLFFASGEDLDASDDECYMPVEWNAITDSVSAANVDSFFACRVDMMQYLEKVREERVAEVFEHDGDIGAGTVED
jgi:hypothetical protein